MVGGLAVVALDEFDVMDELWTAEEAEVDVDEANHPKRFDSFFAAPVVDGDSCDEPVVLLTPNDDVRPWRSFAAADVDASKSKFCELATFPPKSNSTLSARQVSFVELEICLLI